MPTSPENDAEAPSAQPDAGSAEPEPEPEDAKPARGSDVVEELKDRIAAIEDRYRRARADLENYRKRMERELERRVGEAGTAVTREWLEAVDSVERALRLDPDDEGLRAVLHQMETILTRRGIARVEGVGATFDPQKHEAIAAVPTTETPDQTVVEVARSGFEREDGSVIRPAQVVVASHRTDSS